MKYLVLTIRKPTFNDSARAHHYAYLKRLRDNDILEQAGPFTDRSGGAYVIRADDFETAKELAEQDPLHLRNCSQITVHEWDAN